jgi:hypothetical protein
MHECPLQLVLNLLTFKPYILWRNYIKRIQWERSPSGRPSHHPACRGLLALYLEHSLCLMKVEVVVKAILPMEGTRDQMEHQGPSNAYTTCNPNMNLQCKSFAFATMCPLFESIWYAKYKFWELIRKKLHCTAVYEEKSYKQGCV